MAGYTRQSIADIINGAEITAPPLNAEFNQLSAAFNAATGHSHDGTSGNSPKINLTTSSAGYLPAAQGGVGGQNNTTATTNPVVTDDSTQGYAPGSIWENTTTGRIFICVGNASGAAVWRELVQVQTSNVIFPEVNDTVDLGTVTNRFQDLFLSGGIAASGNTSFGGTLNVTGSTALSSTLAVTGLSTLATVDINAGSIDGTVIGAASPAAGNFTTLSTTGQVTLASIDINGGTIDGTVIGGSTPSTVTGTNITSTTGFSGDLTGSVTGNVTGNLSGNVTGNVAGNVTGDVTSTGTSTFQNVTINGSLNLNAGTAGTVTGLSTPVNATDAATKLYVDTSVTNLVASAPGALDTLNELAAALGDDPNFATTVTTSIATKVSKAGDTMTGNLAMSNAKITGLGTPTVATDAATKGYVDGQDATKLNLSGGTMTGGIVMGANKITSTATPTVADDLTRKGYVDGILGSATAAATSASNASTSASNAASSEAAAGASATAASNSASAASTAETNASGSASAASTSATNASNSATAASNSSTAASASATNSANSASAAATSETNAGTSATNASNSASAASTSATNASTSETNAANSASAASTSATNASNSASAAASSYDSFDDRYLGSKASAPSVDNDGDALLIGALYWNTTVNSLFIWTGSVWSAAVFDTNGALFGVNNLSDLSDAATARTNLGLGTAATTSSSAYATAAQGMLADSAVQPNDNVSELTNDAGYTTNVGTITGVTAGAGLTGGGTSGGITVSHADTSTQGSVNNSGRTFIQDITLDTYGHITGIVSATDTDTFTGTVTSVGGTGTVNGLSLTGAVTTSGNLTLGGTLAISNADWSGTDLAVTNGGTGASSFTANTVLLGNGTSSFQTVAPSTSGNVLTSNGTTWVSQPLDALNTQTATTSSTTQTAIATYATASFDAAKVVVTADNGTDRTVSELLITWKSTTAYATEYAIINTSAAALASYTVDVSGGNFRILATAASATSTSYTIKAITL